MTASPWRAAALRGARRAASRAAVSSSRALPWRRHAAASRSHAVA
ncbi:MAG: hypothetical protein WEG40_14295 [Candidatus Rokuibacteriota bacterium]